jgi:regulator of sigma E protease
MRVIKFSIGFGPTLWKVRPKGSPTVFQIGIIPFLAYVQIAGMNPFEEGEPEDKGSYANASVWARLTTIAAGPLMNYFFASVLIFAGFLAVGRVVDDFDSMRVDVGKGGAAEAAGLVSGDRILEVNGQHIANWGQLPKAISAHPGEPIDVVIEHEGQPQHKQVTPAADGPKKGMILVSPAKKTLTYGESIKEAIIEPPLYVAETVQGMVGWISGREKADVSGPVGMVKETKHQAEKGTGPLLQWLGFLSAVLGAFNLLPFPALDGGRLMFLGAELVSRRKADAKVEARIHAIGLLILLAFIAFVTVAKDLGR